MGRLHCSTYNLLFVSGVLGEMLFNDGMRLDINTSLRVVGLLKATAGGWHNA
jgi:hypothetical protein